MHVRQTFRIRPIDTIYKYRLPSASENSLIRVYIVINRCHHCQSTSWSSIYNARLRLIDIIKPTLLIICTPYFKFNYISCIYSSIFKMIIPWLPVNVWKCTLSVARWMDVYKLFYCSFQFWADLPKFSQNCT